MMNGRLCLAAAITTYELLVIIAYELGDTYTWHILVTSRNGNVGVMSLSTCYSLDAVCNDFARLKRKSHSITSHCDCITDTYIV